MLLLDSKVSHPLTIGKRTLVKSQLKKRKKRPRKKISKKWRKKFTDFLKIVPDARLTKISMMHSKKQKKLRQKRKRLDN